MTLIEQWQRTKAFFEKAVAEGRMKPEAAARALARLDERIRRRPWILKRRRDRNTYAKRQAEAVRAKCERAADGCIAK